MPPATWGRGRNGRNGYLRNLDRSKLLVNAALDAAFKLEIYHFYPVPKWQAGPLGLGKVPFTA